MQTITTYSSLPVCEEIHMYPPSASVFKSSDTVPRHHLVRRLYSMAASNPIVFPPLPRLPIEICERIIDFIANTFPTGEHHLIPLTLVCRAWLPRCRFHLCRVVSLHSREGLEAYSRLFTHFPQLADRVHQLSIFGDKSTNKGSIVDTWVSQIPTLLPPLPNLRDIYLRNVDLVRQHPAFLRFYTRLRRTSSIESINNHLTLHGLSQYLQLAHVLHVSKIQARLIKAPLRNTVGVITLPLSPRNTWIERLSLHLESDEHVTQMPWNAILGPRLSDSRIIVNLEEEPNGLFSPEYVPTWHCLCAVFTSISSPSLGSLHTASMSIRRGTAIRVEMNAEHSGACRATLVSIIR